MTARIPFGKPMLVLLAAVLAAHLLLLHALPAYPQPPAPLAGRVLTTRTILIAPPPVAVPQPPKQAKALPARRAIPVLAAQPEPLPAQAAPMAPVATAAAPAATEVAQALPAAAPAEAGGISAEPWQVTHEPTGHPIEFAVPGSARLRYQVTASARSLTVTGQGELYWRHDGTSYEARLEISAPLLPTRVQRSTGAITGAGLAPLRFSDKSRHEEAAHFQRGIGKISFSNNQPDAELAHGAQDRLSVLLQLAAMVAGEPRLFVAGTALTLQTASTRDAEPWTFTVEGQEELRLPGGTLAALKLTRNPRREFDQRVELWLAPGMDYVPVRLRLTQPNGDWVDQQWSSTDKG